MKRAGYGDEFHQAAWVKIHELAERELARPVVLVNGVFDLLHSGHLYLLWRARQEAQVQRRGPGRPRRGTVVCALDSDALTARKKGDSEALRPVCSWIERATALSYMPIDYIVEVDTDEQFVELVNTIVPNKRVRCAQYKGRVSRVAVPTVWIPQMGGLSTSEIIRRCRL